MGWKGTLRTIETEMRRAAREAERRQKHEAKMQALEDAENTVRAFEEYIERITQLHTECDSDHMEWERIANQAPPSEPQRARGNELEAKHKFENYKPGIVIKLLKREEKVKAKLEQAVKRAETKDDEEYQRKKSEHASKLTEWEKKNALAKRLISGEAQAFADVIKQYNPFSDIESLGSGVAFSIGENGNVTATVAVHSDEVIPKEKYSLRQSGTLSTKNMPKGEFNELYQDYVCSCVLRVASELFALLPIDKVLVNANDKLLNSKTGHIEEQTILSVIVMRDTIEGLNLAAIDPSDSMQNFVHHMSFKKTKGFDIVESLGFEVIEAA